MGYFKHYKQPYPCMTDVLFKLLCQPKLEVAFSKPKNRVIVTTADGSEILPSPFFKEIYHLQIFVLLLCLPKILSAHYEVLLLLQMCKAHFCPPLIEQL